MQRDFSDELPTGEPGEHSWMFFLLAPKWVKMRPTDAYYTVHPRAQGSAFRMSNAGSSVGRRERVGRELGGPFKAVSHLVLEEKV